MTAQEFAASVPGSQPPHGLSAPLEALWWDAHGEWARAHALVDELTSQEGMAVHAYLHRKQGDAGNAEYWYQRAGRQCFRPQLDEEWQALAACLLDPAA